MAISFHDVIVQKAPAEYKTVDIRVDDTKPVDATYDWSEPFEWNVGGTMVSVEKAIVIPVKVTNQAGETVDDYVVVGYLGAGGS